MGTSSMRLKLVLPIRAHRGGIRVHLGAKVAEGDKRFGFAGVLEDDAGFRAVLGAEVFVLGEFMEADKLWGIKRESVDLAAALHADESVGAGVLDGAAYARLDGEFLRGEELFAIDLAIDDP